MAMTLPQLISINVAYLWLVAKNPELDRFFCLEVDTFSLKALQVSGTKSIMKVKIGNF